MSAAAESQRWLNPDEVGELTDLAPTSYKAQCRVLAEMGIPFLPNRVGRPLVECAVVETKPAARRRKAEPNWGAIRGASAKNS